MIPILKIRFEHETDRLYNLRVARVKHDVAGACLLSEISYRDGYTAHARCQAWRPGPKSPGTAHAELDYSASAALEMLERGAPTEEVQKVLGGGILAARTGLDVDLWSFWGCRYHAWPAPLSPTRTHHVQQEAA